jgi:hypothetical protein
MRMYIELGLCVSHVPGSSQLFLLRMEQSTNRYMITLAISINIVLVL